MALQREFSSKRVQKNLKDSSKELFQLLEENELTKIKEVFDQEEGRRMNKAQLREVLERLGKVAYDDEKYNLIFTRMNSAWYVK